MDYRNPDLVEHSSPSLSVIIPVFNEEESIPPLLHELVTSLQQQSENWEIICVNDGSTDTSGQVLEQYRSKIGNLRILHFDRNYGQTAAFSAGFQAARGSWLITIDGDGQNVPQDIHAVLALRPHADLICGQRMHRNDPWHQRFLSWLGNRVRSIVCQDSIQDSACSFKAYRAEALRSIKLYQGSHRFFPALFALEGYRVVTVPVQHRPRRAGKSKYSLRNRNLNTALDLFAVWWMRRRRLYYYVLDQYKQAGRP